MASSSAVVSLATPAFDVEQGGAPSPAAEEEGAGFFDYYVVYGFSLFVLSVGTWAFFFPFSESNLVGNIVGAGGLVSGAFIVLNGDLLVTYLRLWRELGRLKEFNDEFGASLVQQKKHVKDLKETQKALVTLEAKSHGRLDNVQSELDEIIATARDSVRRNISGILLVSRPSKQNITAGADLQKTVQVFDNSYVRCFPQIMTRLEKMKEGFEASPRWKRVGSLSNNRLKFILAGVFFEDIKYITEWVRSHLEAETDELASGWYANDEEAEATLSWRAQFEAEEKTAAVASKDSWAEAAAFAGLQEKQVPAVPKEDSWADAIAFAGVDS